MLTIDTGNIFQLLPVYAVGIKSGICQLKDDTELMFNVERKL